VGLANDAHARLLAERCILIKEIIQLWTTSDSLEGIQKELKSEAVKSCITENYYTESFKMMIKTWRRTTSHCEQLDIINSFSFLNFEGIYSNL
jgi:tRNA (guanine10-N2)-methyltransferase